MNMYRALLCFLLVPTLVNGQVKKPTDSLDHVIMETIVKSYVAKNPLDSNFLWWPLQAEINQQYDTVTGARVIARAKRYYKIKTAK